MPTPLRYKNRLEGISLPACIFLKVLGKLLALPEIPWYNRHEKQKCGGLRVLEHPQACTGENHTYTTASNRIRKGYYTTFHPYLSKGAFAVFVSCHFLLGGI
jgi:hypothetical protein